MARHARLYQHVSLDHLNGSTESTTPVQLRALEEHHRELHRLGVFKHCEPHKLAEVPVLTLATALVNEPDPPPRQPYHRDQTHHNGRSHAGQAHHRPR